MRRARKPGRPAQVRRVTARINEQIGEGPVRLVADDGSQLGVMSADDARAYAYERSLDLVEVAAASDPPVCRAMDYGKWRYEEERKLRQARRNQVHVSLKEVRLRPKIAVHDYEWKRNQALDFLHPHGLGGMGWSGGRSTCRLILWLDVHFEFMNDHCHILCSSLG